jgi:adenosylmethionine-8-amino-7-oxononanoate aminotransferase
MSPHSKAMMAEWNTDKLIDWDKRFVWHPFTYMREWCAVEHEPLILAEGRGALLRDSRGREYIDGNSSIWTNIHGHNHPHINAAIRRQLSRVAHTSFLGFTNPAAIDSRMRSWHFSQRVLWTEFFSLMMAQLESRLL